MLLDTSLDCVQCRQSAGVIAALQIVDQFIALRTGIDQRRLGGGRKPGRWGGPSRCIMRVRSAKPVKRDYRKNRSRASEQKSLLTAHAAPLVWSTRKYGFGKYLV